ncbi:hypothetical protein Tco_1545918 [Tanacetum coccineum]
MTALAPQLSPALVQRHTPSPQIAMNWGGDAKKNIKRKESLLDGEYACTALQRKGASRQQELKVPLPGGLEILYYEVLDIPLQELQGQVAFHHATKDEVVVHTIRLPRQITVGDVITNLKTKVELYHKDAEL